MLQVFLVLFLYSCWPWRIEVALLENSTWNLGAASFFAMAHGKNRKWSWLCQSQAFGHLNYSIQTYSKHFQARPFGSWEGKKERVRLHLVSKRVDSMELPRHAWETNPMSQSILPSKQARAHEQKLVWEGTHYSISGYVMKAAVT